MSPADVGARLRLRPGHRVRAGTEGEGSIDVVGPSGEVAWRTIDWRTGEEASVGRSPCGGAAARAVLDRLAGDGGSRQELLAVAVEAEGHAAAAGLVGLLATLAEERMIGLAAESGDRLLAFAIPATPEALAGLREESPPPGLVLAAHASVRRIGRRLVVDSALDDVLVELIDVAAWSALQVLAGPLLGGGVEPPLARASHDDVAAFVELLWRVGLAAAPEREGEHDGVEAPAEGFAAAHEVEPWVGSWELHDLAFHSRSRALGRRRPFGGTHRLDGIREPIPAVRAQPDGPRVALPRPELVPPRDGGPSFASVLEERRSRRTFGDVPLDVAQLGELLFRASRVRGVVEVGGAGGSEHYEVSRRPYPGGGAVYELEIYPVVDRCSGLARGLYHHCPQRHELTLVTEGSASVEALLDGAARTAGSTRPQVLLIFAARFERVFWKYSAIGYATILKDVGVLMQTLMLTATAMGLASCPLGGGSARRFAQATGLDPLVEGSVGEMILGSTP